MQHQLSWWEKSVILRTFDFAVLGAGLIGKQIAIKIKEKNPNARVALIDRSSISYGASTRNAGFACFGSVSEITDDLNRSSTEAVIALAKKRYSGIQQLITRYGAEQIGFRPTGSYEVFTDSDSAEAALSAFSEINRLLSEGAGLKDVFTPMPAAKMGMQVQSECLYNPYEGMLNSGMLNETISDVAHRLGIVPLYGLNITSLNAVTNGYELVADSGIHINCSQLIIANNAFASAFLPGEDIQPARGQIIITEPLNELPFDGIFHSDKGYIYFRNVGNRVLIGGGRNHFYEAEHTYDMQGSDELRTFLETYLRETVLPGKAFKTEMHWSGIMAMGHEKLPVVKRVDPHLSICVRMSGMGVALGPVLSDEVCALL